ncbi:MAG: topoisomerase DNA-binding C4 zinc finger domain-containing protein [Clostridium sp.]
MEKTGIPCPKCGKEVIIKKTKREESITAEANLDCDFMSWQKPSTEKCPECGSYMVKKETNSSAPMSSADL